MPLPAGQETEEIERREAQTRKFGRKAEQGPDYVRIAQQQRDNVKSSAAPRHELDLTFDISVDRVRRIGALLRKSSLIDEFGTVEAAAFMRLFGGQLEEKFNNVLRDFIKEKMSK
jgi:hypothetical protein